jgi:hypothetical protein
LRQIVDHFTGKNRGLLVEIMYLGQSFGVHIHESLPNALSGAA